MKTPLVSICFDDGRETAISLGALILENYGVRGTFYPITRRIGTSNEHGQYASWEQIEKLKERGHEVGSHSDTHDRELINWDQGRQNEDIVRSIDFFKNHHVETTTFAYPFGNHSPELREAVKNAGLRAGRTVEPGLNDKDTDPFLLRSFMIEDKHGLPDVEHELETAMSKNGWLILTFHHLDNKTFISTPPELFEQMIALICKRTIPIVTLAQGLEMYRI